MFDITEVMESTIGKRTGGYVHMTYALHLMYNMCRNT
jgi:hypothetical protein